MFNFLRGVTLILVILFVNISSLQAGRPEKLPSLSEEDKLNIQKYKSKEKGYKDFKFGMSWDEIKATRACPQFASFSKFDGIGYDCYKIAGKKRSLNFYLTGNKLHMILIVLGDYTSSFYDKLVSSIGKKYKETYRLTHEQRFSINEGNDITFFEDARVTLLQAVDNLNEKSIYLTYSKEEHPLYKKFVPKDVSSDDF